MIGDLFFLLKEQILTSLNLYYIFRHVPKHQAITTENASLFPVNYQMSTNYQKSVVDIKKFCQMLLDQRVRTRLLSREWEVLLRQLQVREKEDRRIMHRSKGDSQIQGDSQRKEVKRNNFSLCSLLSLKIDRLNNKSCPTTTLNNKYCWNNCINTYSLA